MFDLCACARRPRRVLEALHDFRNEVVEFIEEPGLEEGSDVMFTVGRLLGALLGILYVPVPGGSRCYRKMRRRFRETGCVRSLRHHPPGVCASTLEED